MVHQGNKLDKHKLLFALILAITVILLIPTALICEYYLHPGNSDPWSWLQSIELFVSMNGYILEKI
jgi:hypothetical protein